MMTFGSAESDVLERVFVSYPKSGRTWFRFIFDLARIEVRFTHAGFSDWRPAKEKKLLLAEEVATGSTVVFLHRNPIDTAVSMFFQRTHRTHRPFTWRWAKAVLKGRPPPRELSIFLRHPGYGVERVCRFTRAWIDHLESSQDSLIVRYEDMVAEPEETLARVLRHYVPERSYDIPALVHLSTFSRMQAFEDGGGKKATELRLGQRNRSDPDSRKVRRGKVGGYRDYLSDAEQLYFEHICEDYGLGLEASDGAEAAALDASQEQDRIAPALSSGRLRERQVRKP